MINCPALNVIHPSLQPNSQSVAGGGRYAVSKVLGNGSGMKLHINEKRITQIKRSKGLNINEN